MLTKSQLTGLLDALTSVRVAVIGDFCLDVYWTLDDAASERSVETGLTTRPVRRQHYSLGGAGTVVNNLLAMGVGRVAAFGVLGEDPFGHESRRLMEVGGVAGSGMLTQANDWDTPAYIKPLREAREENRLDFGNFNKLQDEVGTALVAALAARLPEFDAVIVNQQILAGIHTPHVQTMLQSLFLAHPARIFVYDARHLAGAYHGCFLKANDLEATTLCGGTHEPGDTIALEEVSAACVHLIERYGKPVFISRGAQGCLVADAGGLQVVPGLPITKPTDPVGAGDSMLAGIAAALAAHATPAQAALFGNLVAGVTVRKLFQTGTATPAEILAISEEYHATTDLLD